MKQTSYTASDIERYHRGELSAAEMHTLEKAALDDPLLADALDGSRFTATPVADLTQLRQKLQIRIGEEKRQRGIFYIGNTWVKIAAMVVVFAGAGWLMFKTFSDKSAEVAMDKRIENKSTTSLPQSTSDSSTVYSDAPNSNNVPSYEKQIVTDSIEKNQNLAAARQDKDFRISSSTSNVPAADSPSDNASDVIMLSPQRKSTSESPSNNLEFKAERDEKYIEKELQGKVSGVQLDTIKNVNIVLKPADVTMSEVVVRKREQSRSSANTKMKLKLTADTLKNSEDWDDYTTSNMRKPDVVQRQTKPGEVELAFDTNKKGEAVNITVTKSLCDKCDEEAIRLLKDGPKWEKNQRRGRVRVKFPSTP